MKKQRLYCSYCGKKIISKEQDGKSRDFCPSCNTFYYENPLPVASTIVVNDQREVLLVKRKKDPYKGMWCLPIGFAETGEKVRDAALRELQEEAGVTGEIIRLIDVDTVDNYFYGSLAIVTYEAKVTGGTVCPGDDATDARYFPITGLPELAWSSNDKAVMIYIDLYKDSWAMVDSFKQLYPEINAYDSLNQVTNEQKNFLSNVLIKILSTDNLEITREWSSEIAGKLPKLERFLGVLRQINGKILVSLQKHLQGEISGTDYAEFILIGAELRESGVPLPELLTALALSRKTIWTHVIKKRILASPLEIYTTLELNNRIIFIYDRIIYYLAKGYGV